MFDYSDPSGSNLLSQFNALAAWRGFVDGGFQEGARKPASAFTFLDVVRALPDADRFPATIDWKAFPILNKNEGNDKIDQDRFNLQEEYVEWAVFRDANGEIDEIVFTTEFREYFAILAGVSAAGIIEAIKELTPGADPTVREIYGVANVDAMPSMERQNRFLRQLPNNPWNNGRKGIMALTLRANSFGALFGLAIDCGIKKENLPSDQVCGNIGDACVPGRQSDPRICTVCQEQVRNAKVFALDDPIGIFISNLIGNWTVGNTQIPINDPAQNQGRWQVTRNGRRARLKVGGPQRLKLDNDPITTGAQVADKLFVAANVVTAFEASLPDWARTGNEFMDRPTRDS